MDTVPLVVGQCGGRVGGVVAGAFWNTHAHK